MTPKQTKRPRGYFGIAVFQPKTAVNVGTLWRSAYILGARYIAVIGRRYKHQASDTLVVPRHIPLFTFESFDQFYAMLPYDCRLIGVEMTSDGLATCSDLRITACRNQC